VSQQKGLLVCSEIQSVTKTRKNTPRLRQLRHVRQLYSSTSEISSSKLPPSRPPSRWVSAVLLDVLAIASHRHSFCESRQVSLATPGTNAPRPAPSAPTTVRSASSSSAASRRAPSSVPSAYTPYASAAETSSTALFASSRATSHGAARTLRRRPVSSVSCVLHWFFRCNLTN
jgi:hypothetical protein